MTVLDGTNFAEILSAPVALVDLWATWCGPCRMLSPILDEVEEELAGKMTVVKVNVDDADEIAMRYRIMNIPTLLFFKDGQVVDKSVGALPKAALLEKVKSNL